MADPRDRREPKKKSPAELYLSHQEPLELSADGTYATVALVEVRGFWPPPDRRPNTVQLEVVRSGKIENSVTLILHNWKAAYPLPGLLAGHHYLLRVVAGNRRAERLVIVPTVPSAKEKALHEKELDVQIAEKEVELKELTAPKDPAEEKLKGLQTAVAQAKVEKELEELTEEKPPVPYDILIVPSGRRGNYTVTFQVVTKDGKGVPGAVIRLVEKRGLVRSVDLHTDDKGATLEYFRFKTVRREYVAEIPGTDVRKEFYLRGLLPKGA